MIPVIPKVDLTEAKYTKLYKDIDAETKLAVDTLLDSFGEDEWLSKLVEAKFRYYEICDEDEDVFFQVMSDTFYLHVQYYTELLENYQKEYDYATGNKRIVSRDDNGSATHAKNVSGTSNTRTDNYSLPNRVIDPNDEKGYITDAEITKNSNDVNDTGASSSETHSDITTIYADEFLDLKRKYLSQIRNVYSEFADKFKDCFLHIY